MAVTVNVDGPATVKTGTGTADALETLGLSINGIQIFEGAFFYDVPGDANGGDDGPPIALQFLGRIDRVRMELSSFDTAVADKVRRRLNDDGAVGDVATPGTILDATNNGFRLLILPTNRPINYLFAIPREPMEINKGTKFSHLVIEWECHAVAETLFNTTTA